MMQVEVHPGKCEGTVEVPVSKSLFQRAVAAACMSKGKTLLHPAGYAADCLAALDMARSFGARITEDSDGVSIDADGINPVAKTISCGESGLSSRMFIPIAGLSGKEITFTGEGSLSARPMDALEKILPRLGLQCQTHAGKLPVTISGQITGNKIEMDGSLSSQFLTGVLMALAGTGKSATILVHNLKSKPYIDLTLEVLEKFGVHVSHENYSLFKVPSHQGLQPCAFTVEGDWSAAAFFLVAGAIAGKTEIKSLYRDSRQADRKIMEALEKGGVQWDEKQGNITCIKSEIQAFEFDATDCPDLFPALTVMACYAKGISRISGTERLLYKESNRADVLVREFGKLGASITAYNNVLEIEGKGELNGGTVQPENDHRIAMAAGIAALGAKEKIIIQEAQCVNKSYPDFWKHLQMIRSN